MKTIGNRPRLLAAGIAAFLTAGTASGATLSVTSGLILHLAPDDVTTDGSGNVTSWNDQSGLGNHATQSDTAVQPTLEAAVTSTGSSVLRFDSQADSDPEHLIISSNGTDFDTDTMSWFVVFRQSLDTVNRRLMSSAYLDVDPGAASTISSQAWGSITDTSTGEEDSSLGYRSLARTETGGFNAASAGGGLPGELNTTDFFVGSSTFDAVTDTVTATLTLPDGTQFTDSNTNATLQLSGHLQTLIGAQSGNDLITDSTGWSGDIASIVVYNRLLDAGEIATVTEELRQAYSLVESLQGDLDGDGFVGISDLNLVLANWNLAVPPGDPLADPSGDNFVGIDDLNEVLGNWNAGTPPAPGTAVPEPATLGLITLGGLALARRQR